MRDSFCRMKLVHIMSKTRVKVPMILTPDAAAAIDVIIKYREAYTHTSNEYVFGLPNSKKSIMGWTSLKTICKNLSLENAEAITSTKIRKYVASSSQVS